MALHFITFIVIAPLVLKLFAITMCRGDGSFFLSALTYSTRVVLAIVAGNFKRFLYGTVANMYDKCRFQVGLILRIWLRDHLTLVSFISPWYFPLVMSRIFWLFFAQLRSALLFVLPGGEHLATSVLKTRFVPSKVSPSFRMLHGVCRWRADFKMLREYLRLALLPWRSPGVAGSFEKPGFSCQVPFRRQQMP
ncbi:MULTISPECIES: hypothetical protein [unclassified Pseudomonas]|uniref:hypothetical protein n=1 Tax=unclassified Pseudomonas TaxID=196821 RepID=UPI00126A332F|nr:MULTISPECIES: hypothetical protein [unclassified Pseudomonas]NTX88257.1 hypothetical protein [Pseudomonas sp. UMA643]NTY19307.1 hypothetical protein [Pseudomonas sp. UMC3103]NTY23866.1 hypothetical protein [Pseudomonas sp. UMA603]NTY29287.1 hypothetical protein [Pseudomonas sp. UMC3129]NTY53487.1 hypothetical protein [Pseudomonas sp. UMC631]